MGSFNRKTSLHSITFITNPIFVPSKPQHRRNGLLPPHDRPQDGQHGRPELRQGRSPAHDGANYPIPIGMQAKRAYSSEMANALVQVSQNMGMGSAAIGLGGAGIGIGLVFAALLQAVARNPSLRGQLFSYAILGFAFVEAIGLFDLMVAMMCKYV